VSARIIPLKKPETATPVPPGPWTLGEVFTRDGVDYELVTGGEIQSVVRDRGKKATKKARRTVVDLLSDAGTSVGDHVLVLRPTRPI
jgi:hypothetical protein